jgi:hypothetical protein
LAQLVARRLFDQGGLAAALEPGTDAAALLGAGGVALVPWDGAAPAGALRIHLASEGENTSKADLVLNAEKTPLAQCVEQVASLIKAQAAG